MVFLPYTMWCFYPTPGSDSTLHQVFLPYTMWCFYPAPGDSTLHQVFLPYTRWCFYPTPGGVSTLHQVVFLPYTRWFYPTPGGSTLHQVVLPYTRWCFYPVSGGVSTPTGCCPVQLVGWLSESVALPNTSLPIHTNKVYPLMRLHSCYVCTYVGQLFLSTYVYNAHPWRPTSLYVSGPTQLVQLLQPWPLPHLATNLR